MYTINDTINQEQITKTLTSTNFHGLSRINELLCGRLFSKRHAPDLLGFAFLGNGPQQARKLQFPYLCMSHPSSIYLHGKQRFEEVHEGQFADIMLDKELCIYVICHVTKGIKTLLAHIMLDKEYHENVIIIQILNMYGTYMSQLTITHNRHNSTNWINNTLNLTPHLIGYITEKRIWELV